MNPRPVLTFLLTGVLALTACSDSAGDPDVSAVGGSTEPPDSHDVDSEDGQLHRDLSVADRTFDLYVPDSYEQGELAPAIIVFHGRPSSPNSVMRSSGLNVLAEEHGFLAVYPAGIDQRWQPDLGSPDIDFVAALIAELVESWHADPAQIFVSGHSNGGDMAIAAALSLPDLIEAAAPVTPSNTGSVSELIDELGAPTDLVGFIGESDSRAGDGLAMFEAWRAEAGCGEEHVDAGDDLITHTWTCAEGTTFTVHTLARQGHIWFGGPEQRDPLWASEAMWTFFQTVTR